MAKEDVASACRPYPDQRASTCSCSGHCVSVECSKARVTLMAHTGFLGTKVVALNDVAGTGQSQARALPRPTHCGASFSLRRAQGSHLRTDCHAFDSD